jgi:hypothetical protein
VRRLVAAALGVGGVITLLWLPAASNAFCYRVSSATGAVCAPATKHPRKMVLDVTLEGEYVFVHDATGVDQNACGTSTGTTPNHVHSELLVKVKIDWYHVTVPFGPIHGTRVPVVVNSDSTSTIVGTYLFSGYSYDENCNKVSWPAGGGAACTGVFGVPPGEATNSQLDVNLPPTATPGPNRVNILMTPAEVPAAGLIVNPAGCQDDGNPSTFHTFADAYGDGFETPDVQVSLNVSAGHGVGAYAFAQGTVPSTVTLPVGFVTDCGDPASQLTCTQGWDPPNASYGATDATVVRVTRVGIVK